VLAVVGPDGIVRPRLRVVLGRVDLVADTSPPTVHCPPRVALVGGVYDCVDFDELPPAVDDCDDDPAVRAVAWERPIRLCGVGEHRVEYAAVDEAGNPSTCATVVDIRPAAPK
jgi:hypothetical protein